MGLHGGFAGKGTSNFSKTSGTKLRTDITDPLYALRRMLCQEPAPATGAPPGPPPLAGGFVPLVVGEDLIITEPWEDVPGTVNIFTYAATGSNTLSIGGSATTTAGGNFVYIGSGGLLAAGGAVQPPGLPALQFPAK